MLLAVLFVASVTAMTAIAAPNDHGGHGEHGHGHGHHHHHHHHNSLISTVGQEDET